MQHGIDHWPFGGKFKRECGSMFATNVIMQFSSSSNFYSFQIIFEQILFLTHLKAADRMDFQASSYEGILSPQY